MSNRHSKANRNREHKRAQFATERERKISATSVLVIVFAGLAGLATYLVMGGLNDRPSSTTVAPAGANAAPLDSSVAQKAGASETGDIAIPVSDVNGGKAKFFDYSTSDNKSVRFFLVRGSDGVIRAAFDACDVCYESHRGYHQEGDDMVCNKCGRHFPSSKINEITGGCNPAALNRQIAGDRVIIKASDMAQGAQYF